MAKADFLSRIVAFNTQPPEGGWVMETNPIIVI